MSVTLTDLLYYEEPADQLFELATAEVGAVAFGPQPWSATPPPPISVHVVHTGNLSASVRDLDQSKNRQWTDVANEVGTASVTLRNGDPDLADVTPGVLLQYRLHGWAAFTSIPRQVKRRHRDEAEERTQVSTFTGPGHIAVFDKAPIEPSNGTDAMPVQEDRQFNWVDPSFPDSRWGTSDAMVTQAPGALQFPGGGRRPPLHDATGPNGSYWETVLPDWPDQTAWWVWAHTPNNREWSPAGTCYFRKTFTVPSGVNRLFVYGCFDDHGDLYLDGQKIISADYGTEPGSVNLFTAQVDVTAGTHTFAAGVTNAPDPEGDQIHNPGGFLLTAYSADQTGKLHSSTPIVHTDNSWKISAYPPEPPGMTIGEILYLVLAEWAARSELPAIVRAFSTTFDSNGNPWPTTTDVATKVGTDGATFLLRELGSTYVDLWMEPGSWTLHAWRIGERGRTTSASIHSATNPADPATGNLLGLEADETWDPVTSLLVRHPRGWRVVEDATAIAAYGRRRGTLGLGAAPSTAEVDRVSLEQIALFGRTRRQTAPTHRDDGPTNRPWWAYQNRDRVLVDVDGAGTQESQTVQSVSVAEDDEGTVTYTPVLGDVLREAEARHERTLQKMANGTLGGRSDVAQPVSTVTGITNTKDCCPPAIPGEWTLSSPARAHSGTTTGHAYTVDSTTTIETVDLVNTIAGSCAISFAMYRNGVAVASWSGSASSASIPVSAACTPGDTLYWSFSSACDGELTGLTPAATMTGTHSDVVMPWD